MAKRGMPYTPPRTYAKVDLRRAKRLADAYDRMRHDPSHPLTHAAYDAMVRETMDQYVAAKRAGFHAEFWPTDDEDPYGPSPRLAIEDINKNNHMYVYPTRLGYGGAAPDEVADNPLLQDSGERWNGRPVTVNDIFRATHDYYGHAKEGVGFRHDGEENAWRAHAAMYSPLARIAMTNETRGQNSWVNFGPHGEHNLTANGADTVFAPQKIGVLPPWAVHEGTEDHMPPDDRARVEAAYRLLPRARRDAGGQIQPRIAPSDLFDMSMLHETPNVPQFDLPRYEPPRGVPARVSDLVANPAVREKMHERIHKGRLVGSIWYNAEPLRQEFVKAHGEEVGNRIFRRYMDYVAATSPRSDVSTNARNASYYLHRDITGQGMPTGEKVFLDAKGQLKKLPQPYGHMAQDLHISNARLVHGEGWDPLKNPKPRSFVENLVGNQRPGTIDTHAFRLPAILAEDPRFLATTMDLPKDAPKGTKRRNPMAEYEAGELPLHEALRRAAFWDSQPKKTEYGAMERYYQGLGQDVGLSPAQSQASAWVGGGDLTGLKSTPDMPFMTALHERVMDTARQRNMDPRDVVQNFVRGAQPLLATGGRVGRADGGDIPDPTAPPPAAEPANPARDMVEGLYAEHHPWPYGSGAPEFVIPHHINDQGQAEKFTRVGMKPYGRKMVSLDWISSYPMGEGLGGQALEMLKDRAAHHGVGMTLLPWKHGQVSPAKLHKFYKKHGFEGVKGGTLTWRPPPREGRADGGEAPDPEAPNPVNTETQSRVGQVRFDQRDGAGQVPNNENVNYLGFTAMMKPSRFLMLSHELKRPHPGAIEGLTQHLAAGNAIGSPFLRIDTADGEDDPEGTFGKVRQHDGRHRMRAIQAIQGDTPVPVHVFGSHGNRARHLTPEMIERLRSRMFTQGAGKIPMLDNFGDAFHLGKVLPGRVGRAAGGVLPGFRPIKNPSLKTLSSAVDRTRYNYMRGIYHGGDVHWWDADHGTHYDGAEALGVPYNTKARLDASRNESGDLEVGSGDGVPAEIAARYAAGGNRMMRAEGGGFPKVHKPHLFHSNLHGHRLHVGPIHSAVHGRTDHLPMHVPSGSYVVPADVVSAHGEGNTTAGFKVMRRMFGGAPYGGSGGPYNQGAGPYGEALQNARGGRAEGGEQGVPIVAAGGEYVLSPAEVRAVGNGDPELGTKVMDEWVKRSRAQHIKTLQKLPGPAKD